MSRCGVLLLHFREGSALFKVEPNLVRGRVLAVTWVSTTEWFETDHLRCSDTSAPVRDGI